jgi:hypothetical protein
MLPIITSFFVAIFINGVEITRVGPFADAVSCHMMKDIIDTDITFGFDYQTTYGITADMWGVGGGAIIRYQDYHLTCVKDSR